MSKDPSDFLLALVGGLLGGSFLTAYIAAFWKTKGELKAATKGLTQYIDNQVALTRALEDEKLRVATQGALAFETRKTLYELVVACQSLLHSMCWLAWHAKATKELTDDQLRSYDEEAHKFLPQVLAQQTVLAHLDWTLYSASKSCVENLFVLDVDFGNTIALSKRDPVAAVTAFEQLHRKATLLSDELNNTMIQHSAVTSTLLN